MKREGKKVLAILKGEHKKFCSSCNTGHLMFWPCCRGGGELVSSLLSREYKMSLTTGRGLSE